MDPLRRYLLVLVDTTGRPLGLGRIAPRKRFHEDFLWIISEQGLTLTLAAGLKA